MEEAKQRKKERQTHQKLDIASAHLMIGRLIGITKQIDKYNKQILIGS